MRMMKVIKCNTNTSDVEKDKVITWKDKKDLIKSIEIKKAWGGMKEYPTFNTMEDLGESFFNDGNYTDPNKIYVYSPAVPDQMGEAL